MTLGEEKGESRVLRNGAVQPAGTPYVSGDHLVTRHTLRVTDVLSGNPALIGLEISIWLLGGTAPLDTARNVSAAYYGGGYLIENEYYELDLDSMFTSVGRKIGYSLPAGHRGLEILAPPPPVGGPPGGSGNYVPPSITPEICLEGFTGFDSFEDAIEFANVDGFGRLSDTLLNHGAVWTGSLYMCGGETFYRLNNPFVLDFSIATYSNPYWTTEQAEECAGVMVESIKGEFSPFSNPYSGCGGFGDANNLTHPRILASGCFGAGCEPVVDECDPIDVYDGINCIGMGSTGGALGRTLVVTQDGDYDVKETVEFDIAFNPDTNFDLLQYGGASCMAAPGIEQPKFHEVFVHEMGHALGLAHTSDFSAMMYGDYKHDREVTCHDRARLAVLYPRASCSDDGHGWPCSCGLAGLEVEGVECLAGD